ncbi:5-formyltetrahydrofolate cyclo-ligase [Acinetobacter chinensis]|uniref:5-formyltetrahydrofolate cyclo-ligase n=1 Tax=Acinetobacter chinensis TaxID=2004650 RepID=A0ABU3WBH2_9GAMM|nr:5-formyltetrahydrofolate cyclo-ligase [Acinetobacter chinensis]MDV2467759.1 5-formyltetrahydrofolate cyclo-ligase [Acinetobacter chinensis]
MQNHADFDFKSLRSQMRKQRKALTVFQQRQAQQQVLTRLRSIPEFRSAHKVGIYLDAFGEIYTQLIIQSCFQQNKQVYLPMICNMNQQLVWVRISSGQYRNKRFTSHPLGMLEPAATRGKHVSVLDCLIMPLLVCDMQGSRVGMGGGFYDRTLASASQRPFRLGLAHDFQQIKQIIPRQPWDQPLNALLTPSHFQRFKP